MLVLDTNVFVYALGSPHRLRTPAVDLLSAGRAGRVDLATTPGVVQEFLHVYAARRTRDEAATRAYEILEMCDIVTEAPSEWVALGVDLFRSFDGLNAFDCLLAAVAMREGAGLVSGDRAFSVVPELTWHDLAELDVGQL